jgi:hypothetical protein
MYLDLLGLERGVDPKSAFNSVSTKVAIVSIFTDKVT